ncbi:hypothetical protein GCM10010174_47410 [Kutzneria viridogrisea]
MSRCHITAGRRSPRSTRPYGAPQAGIPQWFRIGVNEGGIKVSTVTTSLGTLGDTIWEARTDLARAHRGATQRAHELKKGSSVPNRCPSGAFTDCPVLPGGQELLRATGQRLRAADGAVV